MTQVVTEIVKVRSAAPELTRIERAAARLDRASPAKRSMGVENSVRALRSQPAWPEGVRAIDMAVRSAETAVFFPTPSFVPATTNSGIASRPDTNEIHPCNLRLHQQQEIELGPELWSTDPDLCCRLRKLEPLKQALRDRAAWVTAIRRDQTIERSTAEVVEWDYRWRLVKINPLLRWSKTDVWDYIRKNDVRITRFTTAYPSIGCTHARWPLEEAKTNAPEMCGTQ